MLGTLLLSLSLSPAPDTTVFLSREVALSLVYVAPGGFERRTEVGELQEVVLTRPFWLGRYEVTREQWRAVMGGDGGGEPTVHPARRMSWMDIQEFLRRATERVKGWTFRLPTEAEWEYAARAGEATPWAPAEDSVALLDHAWVRNNAGGVVQPVGTRRPNAWGFYDMHGNVWEWVADWKADYPPDRRLVDPMGPSRGAERVRRGGSVVYSARAARSSHRYQQPPDRGNGNIGFRVVAVPVDHALSSLPWRGPPGNRDPTPDMSHPHRDRRMGSLARLGTFLALVGTHLAACAEGRAPDRSDEAPQPLTEEWEPAREPGVPSHPLEDTSWRLVELQSMSDAVGVVQPGDPSEFTMRLGADGSVAMRLGCNRGSGTWSSDPSPGQDSGGFRFGPLAVTRVLCPSPRLDERIAAEAEWVRSFLIEDGILYLSLMADGGIQVWEREGSGGPTGMGSSSAGSVPLDVEAGGPRNWQVSRDVDIREAASEEARVIESLAAGMILDHLGCRVEGGAVWCDVQPLGGGPRGFVPAVFLVPAISPDGSVARGPDDSALRAGQGRFDATGTIPCAEASGQPTTSCDFAVARSGGGYATVAVTRPSGGERLIYFRMGRAIGAGMSQAEGYGEFSAVKEEDLHMIQVGTERYEIPDGVVLGG